LGLGSFLSDFPNDRMQSLKKSIKNTPTMQGATGSTLKHYNGIVK
jgi:hypothetical protein